MSQGDHYSMSTSKKRVIIVDDHPLVRERLAQLINHELDMEVCGEAEDTQSAMEIIRDTKPDLAIIDITLRGTQRD
jgi:DNA-binding NarL/FixJ family response regulator